MNPHRYKISIQQGIYEGDELFCATVEEFPDLVSYEKTYQEAYEIMINAIATTYELCKELGKDFPEPKEGSQ